jgi:hypothetical protein
LRHGTPDMVTQMVVWGRPILRHTPFAKQAHGDVAMPGTGKRAIERLEDAREARGTRFCRIQVRAQFSMLSKVGEAAKRQRALYGNRHGCERGRDEAKVGIGMRLYCEMKLTAAFRKQNMGSAWLLLDCCHPAA